MYLEEVLISFLICFSTSLIICNRLKCLYHMFQGGDWKVVALIVVGLIGAVLMQIALPVYIYLMIGRALKLFELFSIKLLKNRLI